MEEKIGIIVERDIEDVKDDFDAVYTSRYPWSNSLEWSVNGGKSETQTEESKTVFLRLVFSLDWTEEQENIVLDSINSWNSDYPSNKVEGLQLVFTKEEIPSMEKQLYGNINNLINKL